MIFRNKNQRDKNSFFFSLFFQFTDFPIIRCRKGTGNRLFRSDVDGEKPGIRQSSLVASILEAANLLHWELPPFGDPSKTIRSNLWRSDPSIGTLAEQDCFRFEDLTNLIWFISLLLISYVKSNCLILSERLIYANCKVKAQMAKTTC
jgi:hypothetical protein